jgi:anti-sigma regulatory factor (Ser/Thr protein kinase)
VAIVIATEAHREAFAARLRAEDPTRLVMLDAAETLARFSRDGRIDRDGFFHVIGGLVRDAAATGRRVRAFGEMVALLWDAGDVMGAIELETLWNELADEVEFSLYCAYQSESVAGHDHADALHQVCHLHSDVVAPAPAPTTWNFPADLASISAARRQMTDALRRRGYDGRRLEDARLIVSELAANAVIHARSAFSVSLDGDDGSARILVQDCSLQAPQLRDDQPTVSSGRGLRLVAMLASRWGVEPASDGKVVWAELAP